MIESKILDDKNVSHETLDRLRIFESLVKKWTKAINLVSKGDSNKIWERHILDSAQIYPYLPKSPAIYSDFGSGGGFPSIVLAALLYEEDPNIEIHLIESDGRKAAFLRTALRELKIPGMVWGKRVQEVKLSPARVVSARAVAPLADLLSMAQPLINKETICFFPKGVNWKKEVEDARKHWSFDLKAINSRTQSDAIILELGSIECVRG